MNRPAALFTVLLLFLSSFVHCHLFLFIQPNPENSYEPGSNFLISWYYDRSGPDRFTHIDLFLMKFAYDRYIIDVPIAYDIDINTTNTFNWNIPQVGIKDGQYFIGAVALGVDYQSYSDDFWIMREYCSSPKRFRLP